MINDSQITQSLKFHYNETFVNSLNLLLKDNGIKAFYDEKTGTCVVKGTFDNKTYEVHKKIFNSDLLKLTVDFIKKIQDSTKIIENEEKGKSKVQVFEEPVTQEMIIEFLRVELKDKLFRTEDAFAIANKKWSSKELNRNVTKFSNILSVYRTKNPQKLKIARTLSLKGNPIVWEFIGY